MNKIMKKVPSNGIKYCHKSAREVLLTQAFVLMKSYFIAVCSFVFYVVRNFAVLIFFQWSVFCHFCK